ncbi:unnamed protein product [Moneuplotes crassus]|uniref:Uncharacterized protein n=1 Tax=Euplotes crassus TaxID=5936 RepID=A0AAD1XD82_EUPCR|nr:unnamed protein product [Moneuplotes crassus]
MSDGKKRNELAGMEFFDDYPIRTTRRTRNMTKKAQENEQSLIKQKASGKKKKLTRNSRSRSSRGSKRNAQPKMYEDEYEISDEENIDNAYSNSDKYVEDDLPDEEEAANSEEPSDSDESFEEFIKKTAKEDKKEEEQDLTKMTKRQKTKYLVENNILNEVKEETVTKKSGRINLEDETVLYSLDSRAKKPIRSEMRPRMRKHKVVSVEELAEKQTEALKKILEDIDRKEKERDSRNKELKRLKKEKEKMDELEDRRIAKLNCIRTLSTLKGSEGQGCDMKVSTSVSFPKNYQTPDIFTNNTRQTSEEIKKKSADLKCDNCGKNEQKYKFLQNINQEDYTPALPRKIQKLCCSFECYKIIQKAPQKV